MGEFVKKTNIITGEPECVIEDDDFDYLQEIARSDFGDMLHDTERNQKYEAALKIAIERVHKAGKKAIVLDIGAGTGLLSMMAVRNGADKVTACEGLAAMSDCAKNLIELNGYKDKIKVIPKNSKYLTVGENGDLDERCNILVTEVFDTELIGEGALSTFNHANEFLLTEDCIVIPNSATVYAQVVECPRANKLQRLSDIFDGDQLLLEVPSDIKKCPGCPALHDIQMSQIPIDSFKTLVKPTPIFEFNWNQKIPLERIIINTSKAECEGKAQVVFIWWDLKMDLENEIILSCAPYWSHPMYQNNNSARIPWRDHWIQAVYFFPREEKFNAGEDISLVAMHDEYSFHFKIKKKNILEASDYDTAQCICGLHRTTRHRIAQINDGHRRRVLMNVLKNEVEDKEILVMGDSPYISLTASKFNAKKVYVFIQKGYADEVLEQFINKNGLNVCVLNDLAELMLLVPENSLDIVLSEPFFKSCILPWENLHYYFLLRKISHLMKKDAKIFPKVGSIKAVAVRFDDLHKIRTPIRKCEGFNMKNFDDLIEVASSVCDDLVEVHPLWEYPATALSSVEELCNISFSDEYSETIKKTGSFKIEGGSPCNGIAIWCEWWHGETRDLMISTGIVEKTEIGKKIKWDLNCTQGVCLFENRFVDNINYIFTVDLVNGKVKFECQ